MNNILFDDMNVTLEQELFRAASNKALERIRKFLPNSQYRILRTYSQSGEESNFFRNKIVQMDKLIASMPKTYEQDGKGNEAIVYLHYFKGNGDWYITEKDMEDEQLQAFGYVKWYGYDGDFGYISIEELRGNDVELDLYWTPKTLKEVKSKS